MAEPAMTVVPATAAQTSVGPLGFTGRIGADSVPVAAGERFVMSWIAEERVPLEHRRFCQAHLDRAAAWHRLGPIRLRWFVPADGQGPYFGGDAWGIAPHDDCAPLGFTPASQPMTIGILASARGAIVPAAIAHEVRHVAQHIVLTGLGACLLCLRWSAYREADADRFATWYIGQLEARGIDPMAPVRPMTGAEFARTYLRASR